MEVRTPVLVSNPGGAAARPQRPNFNALMRILKSFVYPWSFI